LATKPVVIGKHVKNKIFDGMYKQQPMIAAESGEIVPEATGLR